MKEKEKFSRRRLNLFEVVRVVGAKTSAAAVDLLKKRRELRQQVTGELVSEGVVAEEVEVGGRGLVVIGRDDGTGHVDGRQTAVGRWLDNDK